MVLKKVGHLVLLATLAFCAMLAVPRAQAQSKPRVVTGHFGENFSANAFFDDERGAEPATSAASADQAPSSSSAAAADSFTQSSSSVSSTGSSSSSSAAAAPEKAADKPAFVTADPTSHITPPDENAKVRINPEAPGPFIAMADAYQKGDITNAKLYARQFVRYLSDLMFQVRAITQLIGEAMVAEGTIDEEDWVGVEQYLDYEMALARQETASPIKITHEEAMKRIAADPKGEAEIYYFFTLNCSWCRKMAPDVERLWRVAKSDPRLKMVALTLGPTEKEWIGTYRDYTGLTVPIFNGQELAKTFRVRFVPAVVIAAPNTKALYLKTGQQSFERLYDFVRTVQGHSGKITPAIQKLMETPIGRLELAASRGEHNVLHGGRFGEDPAKRLIEFTGRAPAGGAKAAQIAPAARSVEVPASHPADGLNKF